MKTFLLSFVAILGATTSYAWTTPQKPATATRQDFFQALLVGVGVMVAPLAAEADTPFEPSTFSHQYNDPKHPNCKRIVVVKPDGTVAVSGTDGNPGCPEDGSGNVWRLVGEVEGNKLLVDFSPKGGPPNLKGVWEEKDGPGIRWPDGNKWTVKE